MSLVNGKESGSGSEPSAMSTMEPLGGTVLKYMFQQVQRGPRALDRFQGAFALLTTMVGGFYYPTRIPLPITGRRMG